MIRKLYKFPDRVALNKKDKLLFWLHLVKQHKQAVIKYEKLSILYLSLKIVMKRENIFGLDQSGLPIRSRILIHSSFWIIADSDPTVKNCTLHLILTKMRKNTIKKVTLLNLIVSLTRRTNV
jgi:hypothetical protein